jgi:chromosome segregation ATPase
MTPLLSAHSVALHAARTSAEFAAVISALDTDLNAAMARKAELEKAEDKAIFGDGDLAEVRKELADCNSEIALYEKAIEGADVRRIEAAKNEAAVDIEALGKDAKAKAADLSKRWKNVRGHIEAIRAELFECDALRRSLIATDGEFEKARRPDLRINLTTVRREAMAGPRASIPARLSRPAIQADTVLLSFLSLGGPLDGRAGVRAQTNGVTSNADYRHQQTSD